MTSRLFGHILRRRRSTFHRSGAGHGGPSTVFQAARYHGVQLRVWLGEVEGSSLIPPASRSSSNVSTKVDCGSRQSDGGCYSSTSSTERWRWRQTEDELLGRIRGRLGDTWQSTTSTRGMATAADLPPSSRGKLSAWRVEDGAPSCSYGGGERAPSSSYGGRQEMTGVMTMIQHSRSAQSSACNELSAGRPSCLPSSSASSSSSSTNCCRSFTLPTPMFSSAVGAIDDVYPATGARTMRKIHSVIWGFDPSTSREWRGTTIAAPLGTARGPAIHACAARGAILLISSGSYGGSYGGGYGGPAGMSATCSRNNEDYRLLSGLRRRMFFSSSARWDSGRDDRQDNDMAIVGRREASSEAQRRDGSSGGKSGGGEGGEGGGGGVDRPQMSKSRLAEEMARATSGRSYAMMLYLLAMVIAMVGTTYAAVPLYRMFCQATGFGGTIRRRQTIEEKIGDQQEQQDLVAAARNREVLVRFNADVADGMAWKFVPCQRDVLVRPGESTLAFYTAQNMTKKPVTGVATYNVSPQKAGAYFNKIQCFCFEEQRLQPGEVIDMPVFFYIDREFATDPKMDDITSLTLSYTFFKAPDEEQEEEEEEEDGGGNKEKKMEGGGKQEKERE